MADDPDVFAPSCCDGELSADRPEVAVPVVIGGHVRSIDRCIAPLVRALNDAGMATVASCCGHGRHHGSIVLADGRDVQIKPFDPAGYEGAPDA